MAHPEDEYTDQPPPRRRRSEDEFTDEPARRDDLDFRDDYDVRLPPTHQLSGMDGFFANTHIVLFVILALCCNGIALILGIVGLIVCKDPRARQNALITTIIGGIITALGLVAQVAMRVR